METQMKRVRGYLTQDNTFFELEVDANLYEAEIKLRGRAAVAKVDPDRLIDAIRILNDPLWNYLNAIKAKNDPNPDLTIDFPVVHPSNVGSEQDQAAPILQQSAIRDEHVSDLGGDPQPETIRVKRKGART